MTHHIPIRTMKPRHLLVLSTALIGAAHAFPPAPHYTLYGIVRDQVGQTLSAPEASVVIFKNDSMIGRTPITSRGAGDWNYDLNVPLDMMRTGTRLYSPDAVASQGVFSLAVEMNGVRFYPIEVDGGLTAGKGGERVRLDLTLGEDSDRDGLPDVWEQWQLFQAGHSTDENGWDISGIDRDGDFDQDGQSNWMEYLAGTFAGDPTEFLALEIREKSSDAVHLEFYGITSKAYSLQRSTDLKTWVRIPFALTRGGPTAETHHATSSGVVQAFAAAADTPGAAYRLEVR